MTAATLAARGQRLLHCHACGLTCRGGDSDAPGFCPRCRAHLHWRKPESCARTWAYLLAASILYIPANLLPILHTQTLLYSHDSTIIGGIALFWNAGAWDLATIVFVASIVVPLAKIASLAFLLVGVQRRSCWHPETRTRLYRMIDFVGHWSMLDVLVVGVLAVLVQFGGLADARPEAGAVAFGAVVVLTMLASMSFDPRLIWDAAGQDDPGLPP